MGSDAVPVAPRTPDARGLFARNGAAEVLQDVGFVDFLALDNPRSPLLERIYAAGGERFSEAADRAGGRGPTEGRSAGGMIETFLGSRSSSASATCC